MAHRPKPSKAFLIRLVGLLGPHLIRLIGATWRFQLVDVERYEKARREGQKFVFAFWHQSQLVWAYFNRGQKTHVLVSHHADGEMIARALEGLGFGTVRGSTTRGGSAALRRMVRVGRDGYNLAVTPDGPKGPRHKVQPGVITLARLTGMPIVRGTWYARPMWEFGSWDRFRIPWPFARIGVILSEPFRVPRDISPEEEEEYRWKLEEAMMKDAARVEAHFR